MYHVAPLEKPSKVEIISRLILLITLIMWNIFTTGRYILKMFTHPEHFRNISILGIEERWLYTIIWIGIVGLIIYSFIKYWRIEFLTILIIGIAIYSVYTDDRRIPIEERLPIVSDERFYQ